MIEYTFCLTNVVTITVIALSVAAMILITIVGYRNNYYRSIAIWVSVALGMMLASTICTSTLPQYFGISERFSVFSAMDFTGVFVVYLFLRFKGNPSTCQYSKSEHSTNRFDINRE